MPNGHVNIEAGIQRTPDGTYWVRASMRHPQTGKMVSRSATLPVGATLYDARKHLAALRVEVEEKVAAPSTPWRGRPTLSKCAKRWIAAHYDRNRHSTAEHYERVLTDHVLKAPVGPEGADFGDLYAEAVTRADVDRWCRWAEKALRADGERYAPDTVKGWWRVLCGFLRDTAADVGQPDPIVRVKPPRVVGQGKRREQRTLSREQLGALVDTVDERWRAEVYLLSFTGMRPGELYALEWGDIDEVEGCIHVRRAHKRGKVESTKTDAPRDLALTARLREILEAHRRLSMQVEGDEVALPPALGAHFEQHGRVVNADVRRLLGFAPMKARLALRSWCEAGLVVRKGSSTRPYYVAGEGLVAGELLPRVPARPLVFPSRAGTFRTPESLHKPLAVAAVEAGLKQRVSPHVLRRTFNTLLLRAGIDRTVLRSQMGHCSEQMTERYAGVSIDAKREAVELLEEEGEE